MAVDPWASTNQGLGNLSNTLASLAQLKRQDQQYADEAPERANRQTLANLQVTAAQQAMDDGQAKRNALIDLYGTAKHADPLASAYSFQGQEQQDAEQQKAAREKQKYAFDEFTKVAKAVDDGVIEPKAATDYYHNAMKLSGIDLQAAGVNLEFQKQKGGYFSGPVFPDSIFMMGGKPTPYRAQGIVSKARIVGQDPQSGKPIFEMDENTTFAESKPDQEALIDKRFANQQKLQAEQIAAQDRRTAQQISAADRRSAERADGSSKAPSGYRWSKGGELEAIPGGPGDTRGGKGGKVLPAGQLESIADMKRVKDVMAEARQALSTKKVDTGPVMGRLQSLGSSVGLASDNFVDVQQKLQTAENIMLKLRSGAAVTESEYSRFQKEFPRVSDPPEIMKRKMNNAIAYANTLMDDKLSIYEEGGYRIPQSVKSNGAQAAPSKAQASAKPATKSKSSGGYSDLLNKYKR